MGKSIFVVLCIALPFLVAAQSHNYWTRSFNEESSLLSGAVVGGGAGPSAIYFNPASISEVQASKFSLNASLFAFNFINNANALGDQIDLNTIIAKVEPRSISYMLKPKKHQNWSFEVAFLNNENEKVAITSSVDVKNHVLTSTPGEDRYTAFFQYSDQFRDDWIGIGASTKLSKRFTLGISMFATIKSLEYRNSIDIQAYPLNDTIPVGGSKSFYAAGYEHNCYLKFNDYRLLWKVGLICKLNAASLGLTITTPSVGVYSDGKRVERKQQQSNITNPGTGLPMPDYLITDYEEQHNVEVSYNTPFSVAAGMTYTFRDGRRVLYLSMEYFSGIDPYRLVQAEESSFLACQSGKMLYSDWLTYASGAKPIFNVAVGYSWTLNDKLLLKTGFRTDFNYQKNLAFGEYSDYSRIQHANLDLYYLTCGLAWEIFGQDIITGIQYCFGRSGNQKQMYNLSDPVEYNFTEQKALQGTRLDNMTSMLNSIVLYLGFSLNFGEKKKPQGP